MKPTREEMIQALIGDWLGSIAVDGAEVVRDILDTGFIGYRHMLDDELLRLYTDAGLGGNNETNG